MAKRWRPEVVSGVAGGGFRRGGRQNEGKAVVKVMPDFGNDPSVGSPGNGEKWAVGGGFRRTHRRRRRIGWKKVGKCGGGWGDDISGVGLRFRRRDRRRWGEIGAEMAVWVVGGENAAGLAGVGGEEKEERKRKVLPVFPANFTGWIVAGGEGGGGSRLGREESAARVREQGSDE